MGVSGSGKSTIGVLLGAALDVPFLDGDALHPAANVEKMSRGIPLDDADRWPWLDRVAARLRERPLVVACSALRRAYRDRIRATVPAAFFVELSGSPELLAARMTHRPGHFMPPALLDSQLATLEELQPDEAGIRIGADEPPADIVRTAVAAFTRASAPTPGA